MAAIRSHFISLFSGAIFPDRKWWLSCFCLPHSKDEKPARQNPPTDRAIYTIQTSHDEEEEPKTEFGFFSGAEGTSVHEEESHSNGVMVGEAPLANGFRMQLLDSLRRNNRLQDDTARLTREVEENDVVDVALPSSSENITTEAIVSSSCFFLEASLSCDDTVKAFEDEESLTDIQSSTADNDRETVASDVVDTVSTDEGLAGDQSVASCLSSCDPIFTDLEESPSSPRRQIPAMNDARDIAEIVNEMALEDDPREGLKSTTDLASTSSPDISSNLETSGIQSNLSSFEDTSLQSSACSENGTVMPTTSDEDSEPCFQATSHDLFHAPDDSCHVAEISAVSTCSNDRPQEMGKSTSTLSPLSVGMVSSESTEKPFDEGSCLEPYNGITEQETVLADSHTSDAVPEVILLSNNFDKHSLPSEVGEEESDDLFKSKCDVTEDCTISNQLLEHGTQNIADASCSVASDVCLTTEQSSNQATKAELETTFAGITVDSGNSADVADISAKSAGNAESTFSQFRPDALTPRNDEEVVLIGESSDKCGDGNDYVEWGNCGVKDKEMSAFDERMGLCSQLQTKLLFRPDSYDAYETLKRLVDDETAFLLGKALDDVFTERRNRETLRSHGRKGLGDIHCEVTIDESKAENGMLLPCNGLSSIGRLDPFDLPKSNVFQEIVIENFEQLFDNEEWLDDDFGFSSDTKSEFQRPPYCDRIIGQQDYSREAFRLRDFELEDDFLSPDLQVPVIQLMPETLFPLVDQATDIFWSRRRYGEPVSSVCPPETYFSAESRLDNVDSCSQRSHETFVFHLVSEILQEIYSDELTEIPEPWQRVQNFKPKFTENPPTTIDVLKPLVHSQVSKWLKFQQELTKKGAGLRKQLDKKDMVDRLLITEMYQEEPSWTDYSQDANLIKNRVANKLLVSLIDDTVQAFKSIQSNALTNDCQ